VSPGGVYEDPGALDGIVRQTKPDSSGYRDAIELEW
jgi:hypothetical protein